MADLIFNSFKEYMADGTLDLDNDSFKICLLTSSYTPDATHAQYSNLTNEVSSSGTGYTTGGKALTNVVWVRTAGTVKFDADDPQWTSATFTCRYAVIYDDTSANDNLVCLFDFSTDKSVTSGTFTVQFNSAGIFTVS